MLDFPEVYKAGVALSGSHDARYFNHSEEPNTVDLDGPEGPTVAARDIQPGEELTCDYRLFDADVLVKLRMAPP